MPQPEFAGLEFNSATRIATDTHKYPMPFQLALLEGYPDTIAAEPSIKIDNQIVDVPTDAASRVHLGIARAAALQAQNFQVDCINFGALVAGEVEERRDINELVRQAADDPAGVMSYVDHSAVAMDDIGELELFTYGRLEGKEFRGEHVATFLPVTGAATRFVLSKFGLGSWIGITDRATPGRVYSAPDVALIDRLHVAYRGEVIIRYER